MWHSSAKHVSPALIPVINLQLKKKLIRSVLIFLFVKIVMKSCVETCNYDALSVTGKNMKRRNW